MPPTVTRCRVVSERVSDGSASIHTFMVRHSALDLMLIGGGAAPMECFS
jgi:hypothetical protein